MQLRQLKHFMKNIFLKKVRKRRHVCLNWGVNKGWRVFAWTIAVGSSLHMPSLIFREYLVCKMKTILDKTNHEMPSEP